MLSLSMEKHKERIHRAIQPNTSLGSQPSDTITRSWLRCIQDYGLSPENHSIPPVLTFCELQEQLERNAALIQAAKYGMQTLYQQLADPTLTVVLVDAKGVILHLIASDTLKQQLHDLTFMKGAIWSEKYAGTNGMGTSLASSESILVQKNDHFFLQHAQLSCAAAPIFDHNGELIGALDITSHSPLQAQHTILTGFSARSIENRLLEAHYKDAYILYFHSCPKSVFSVHGGKLVISGDGKLLSANRNALSQLGISNISTLQKYNFDDLFQSDFQSFLTLDTQNSFEPASLYPINTPKHLFAVARLPHSIQPKSFIIDAADSTTIENTAAIEHTKKAHILDYGEPKLKEQYNLAQQLFKKNVPLLIYGETGAGKEIFARAIHESSSRSKSPFITISCPSLSESFLESVLFDKFTKVDFHTNAPTTKQVDEPHRCTLFLDQLGDIKPEGQARLLRLLDKKNLWLPKAERYISIDCRIISASNQKLEGLLKAGALREDLYYRLSGVELHIPPLRKRQDRRLLIHAILQEEASQPVDMCPTLEEHLLTFDWPGNIRQLRHMLRSIAALAIDNRIQFTQLPENLKMALKRQQPKQRMVNLPPPHQEAVQTSTEENLSDLNPLEIAERRTIMQLLEENRWNISATAKALEMSRNTLYRRMRKLKIPRS